MSNLTAEQLKQIERNRAMAIMKKKKAMETVKDNTSFNQPKLFNGPPVENQSKTFFQNQKPSFSSPQVSAVIKVISKDYFLVDMPFHGPSIEIFKTIPGKMYDPVLKKWTFPLTSYETLTKKLEDVALVHGIPKIVLHTLRSSDKLNEDSIDLSKIDSVLLERIMPFQEDGIRFGISRGGRCLIADDMGLGKTIQALGIAHYYKENWPLLIVCPSSMRFPWEEAIQTNLPSVIPYYITVMTTSKDFINEAQVVICSYDLMKSCLAELQRKKFGVLILDESHSLKSLKTARTKAALQIASKCKNVILLSGTPALSRPEELYSQISAVDPLLFRSLVEFGVRYCDGKKDKFGWNFSGSSNMEELELFLKKRLMIRRMKSDVITQLPSKLRKVVYLNPSLVKAVEKQMKKFANDMENQKGMEKRSTLLSYYSLTGDAKVDAVCEYIAEKLEGEGKFLVFAHHTIVIHTICDMLGRKNVDHIRIDGSTNSELRKAYCDRFQSKENCRVAVLSIKAANSGVTLTAAALVIFAELYWNPGELMQAEDRAHRIGQQDSVIVEYLVAKGTADDHIWNLVQSKLTVLSKAGLSKDNFRDTATEQLGPKQQRINDIFKSSNPSIKSGTEEVDLFGDNHLFDDLLIQEEDLFSNIKLEQIENQYQMENKRRKI